MHFEVGLVKQPSTTLYQEYFDPQFVLLTIFVICLFPAEISEVYDLGAWPCDSLRAAAGAFLACAARCHWAVLHFHGKGRPCRSTATGKITGVRSSVAVRLSPCCVAVRLTGRVLELCNYSRDSYLMTSIRF